MTVALAASAWPFFTSLLPTEAVREAHRVNVDLHAIPEDGYAEVTWSHGRVFLVRTPELRAYGIPFEGDAYLLPDPTWDLARTPCGRFELVGGTFVCTDQTAREVIRSTYRWNKLGQAVDSTWPPPLRHCPFGSPRTSLSWGRDEERLEPVARPGGAMNAKQAAKLERQLEFEESQLRQRLMEQLPYAVDSGYDLFTTSRNLSGMLARHFAQNDALFSAAEQCVAWRETLGLPVDGTVGRLYLEGCTESAGSDPHRRGPKKLASWLLEALSDER